MLQEEMWQKKTWSSNREKETRTIKRDKKNESHYKARRRRVGVEKENDVQVR